MADLLARPSQRKERGTLAHAAADLNTRGVSVWIPLLEATTVPVADLPARPKGEVVLRVAALPPLVFCKQNFTHRKRSYERSTGFDLCPVGMTVGYFTLRVARDSAHGDRAPPREQLHVDRDGERVLGVGLCANDTGSIGPTGPII